MDNLYYNVLQNDINHKLVLECTARLTDVFLKEKYNVILEGVFTVPFNKHERKLEHGILFKLARKYKTKLKIFFLNVSIEKALQRAKKRASKKLSPGYVKKLHEKVCHRRHKNDIEINTDNLTPLQVANRIINKSELEISAL